MTKPLYPDGVIVAVCLDCGGILGAARPSRKGTLPAKHAGCTRQRTKLSGVMGVRYRLDIVHGLVALQGRGSR